MSAREAESEESVKAALASVVHLTLSVLKGEGVELSKTYGVGVYYPVFILMNSEGDVYSRWTGYTGAERFLKSFRAALNNPITVKGRAARFEANPTRGDGMVLARYYTDTQDYLQAAQYYRRNASIGTSPVKYHFQIFSSLANAAWNGQIDFDTVLPAADALLASPRRSDQQVIQLTQMITNVARKLGHTDRIEKYLLAGIDVAAGLPDARTEAAAYDFQADMALYLQHDTTEALRIKKYALGPNWTSDPATFYSFGEWCFRRKINLEEAQQYVKQACDRASEGTFRARHLRLLSEICFERGQVDKAIRWGEQAWEEDPTAAYFDARLTEMRQSKMSAP